MKVKDARLNFRIIEDEKFKLDAIAQKKGMNISQLLREIIKVYLNNVDYFEDIFFAEED